MRVGALEQPQRRRSRSVLRFPKSHQARRNPELVYDSPRLAEHVRRHDEHELDAEAGERRPLSLGVAFLDSTAGMRQTGLALSSM